MIIEALMSVIITNGENTFAKNILEQVLIPDVINGITLVNNMSILKRQFYCIYQSSCSPEESNSTCGGCLDFCCHVV